jgi:hypothetical protein
MLIAVLFTIAKLWNQPRCPSNDKWIKKMWYVIKEGRGRVCLRKPIIDGVDLIKIHIYGSCKFHFEIPSCN